MPEELPPDTNLPAPSKAPGRRHRGRRGGRGRRRPSRPSPQPSEEQKISAPVESMGPDEAAETPSAPVERPKPYEAPRERAPEGSAISNAVSEVTHIVESLRQSLAQMEEVLELVELAERQKLGDEREIDSLRRALRRIHQPRGGHSHPEE